MFRLHRPKLFLIKNEIINRIKSPENTSEIYFVFQKSAKDLRTIKEVYCYETLLHLYSLYKQATLGDIQIPSPINILDFYAKAKYDAWLGQKGKTSEKAMKEYIYFVHRLKTTYC